MTSPLYGFPELTGTTVERTATNLNFRYIESLFGSAPTGVNVFTPPTAPTDGSVYLINSGGVGNPTPPTGIWSGKSGQVGVYTSSGWFYTNKHPQYTFGSGYVWTQTGGGGSGVQLGTVNTFTKSQGIAPVALTDGSNIAVDLSLSNNLTVTTAGNRAFANPTNMVAGHSFNLFVTQDSVGNRVPTWGSAYKFGTNGVPTPSTNANTTDWYQFYCDGSSMIFDRLVKGSVPSLLVIGNIAANGSTIYKLLSGSTDGLYSGGFATAPTPSVHAGWNSGLTSYTFTTSFSSLSSASGQGIALWVRASELNATGAIFVQITNNTVLVLDAGNGFISLHSDTFTTPTSGTIVIAVTPTTVGIDINSGAYTYTLTSALYSGNTGVGFTINDSVSKIANFPSVL